MSESTVDALVHREYSAGFITEIESETLAPGLDETVVRFISARKSEPGWLTDWRLDAFRRWQAMTPPEWAHVHFPPIDYQSISYYSAPKSESEGPRSLAEVDPELLRTYAKLGIPLHEQELLAGVVKRPPGVEQSPEWEGSPEWERSPDRDSGVWERSADRDREIAPTGDEEEPARPRMPVAVDAVFDSVSIATTFKDKLAEAGVVFCAISEAVHTHPELVRKYLGSVVPVSDNYYAGLNSAVFSDGSFVYVPEGVRCPMELSTYFRINARNTGQFERTLIIAERGAYVSYLEGCTAPMRDENQLHAAVVELVALEDAQIKYSTVQNWYPGDKDGKGGIYNFVTKRGVCLGDRAKISWTQVETGSAITWKYPSVVLRGNDTVGEFYSVALTNNFQQADTGTKMIHMGRNTKSTIVSKGISAGHSQNTYRGLVRMTPTAVGARNYTQCDSLLIGPACGAHTFPYIENRSATAIVEHEASTSKVSEEQLFLCQQRGIDPEKAVAMIVNGFCRAVFRELPMEFAVEAGKLLEVSLEGAVG